MQAPWMNGFTPHAYRQACATPEAWDLHAPWRPWAELPDLVSSIRLELTWSATPVQVHFLPVALRLSVFVVFSDHALVITRNRQNSSLILWLLFYLRHFAGFHQT